MKRKYIKEICSVGKNILRSDNMQSTKYSIQHGSTTVFEHCVNVTGTCLAIADRFHIQLDRRSLIRGALLHDYFLYDWHADERWHRLHGYTHAARALYNARREFELNSIEEDMIYSHMFPLNLTHIPHYRESLILCIADKYCSTLETFSKSHGRQVRPAASVNRN